MKIKILFEDKDILAIDKPSGISVHPSGKLICETISDWFAKNYPKSKDVGELLLVDGKEIKKPGIVHRLDKDTSGVLVLAKNQKSFESLKTQFQNREVMKTYVALVYGNVKNDTGIIDAEIGRSKNDPRLRTAMRGKRGKLREAITEYKVIKRMEIGDSKFTLLELHPKTGRTHQIRVHMKFLNHPIVCDSLYAPKNICPESISRLALYAKSIEFKDLKNKTVKIEADLPKEIKKLQK